MGFPVEVSLEQIQKDTLTIYRRLFGWYARFMVPPVMMQAHTDMLFSGRHPEGVKLADLTYSDIEETAFARSIEWMYRYGYLGEQMRDVDYSAGRELSSVAYVLSDIRNSQHQEDSAAFGLAKDTDGAVQRCLDAAELANARRILEGNQGFIDPDKNTVGFTVRQLALLSGMKEMSIRSAASRSRGELQVEAGGRGGSTFIKFDVAKAWLLEKNRYVEVRQLGPDRMTTAEERKKDSVSTTDRKPSGPGKRTSLTSESVFGDRMRGMLGSSDGGRRVIPAKKQPSRFKDDYRKN